MTWLGLARTCGSSYQFKLCWTLWADAFGCKKWRPIMAKLSSSVNSNRCGFSGKAPSLLLALVCLSLVWVQVLFKSTLSSTLGKPDKGVHLLVLLKFDSLPLLGLRFFLIFVPNLLKATESKMAPRKNPNEEISRVTFSRKISELTPNGLVLDLGLEYFEFWSSLLPCHPSTTKAIEWFRRHSRSHIST